MRNLKIIIPLLIVTFGLTGWYFFKESKTEAPSSPEPKIIKEVEIKKAEPIEDASARVTLKPFGKYVTPTNSPVKPERFQGYHTGADLEIKPEEANSRVLVKSICDGEIILAQRVNGYGGLIVQRCQINGAPHTVLYGHLGLADSPARVGRELKVGDSVGYLGQPGPETDGERKHLHLGIHQGTAIDYRGYVTSREALSEWLDPFTLF